MNKLLIIFLSQLLINLSFADTEYTHNPQALCDLNNLDEASRNVFLYPNSQKIINGESVCFYENSNKYKSKGNIKNGYQDGKWTFWYENGKKKYEQNFLDGNLNGLQIVWHDNGQIKSKTIYKIFEDQSRKEGFTEWTREGGLLSDIDYEGGRLSGKVVLFFENGQKQYEKSFKADHLDGKWSQWDENGKLIFEKNYKNGLLDGKSTLFYNNGKPEEEKFFSKGELDGEIIFWRKSGQIFLEGFYKDNQKHGKWITWNKNGQKTEERIYEFDELVNRINFKYSFFTGKLKSKSYDTKK